VNDVSKKYILNLCTSELSSDFTSFFEENSFEVHNKSSESIQYDFIIIDDIETTLTNTAPVIFKGNVLDKANFFKNNGKAIITEKTLECEIEKIIFLRLLGVNSSLSLEKAFNKELNTSGEFKLTDHLSTGYYCDLVSSKAAILDFDFLNIRNGFFNLINFISLTIDSKAGSFPVDVEFGNSSDKFIIQTHYNVENFGAEYLWNSFSENENNYLLKTLDFVDSIDCYVLEKTGRLVLTLIFSKSEVQNQNVFIHNIKSFKLVNVEELVNQVESNPIDHFGDVKLAKEKVQSISKVQEILEDDQTTDGHLVSVTRVAKFLKTADINIEELSFESIDNYLENYPNKEILNLLTVNDKKLIIDSVKDNNTLETLSTSLDDVEKVVGLDDFLDSLVTKIDGLSLEQANEIVSISGAGSEKDSITRVGGWLDNDNHSQVVKGTKEDLGEKSQLIKGTREDLTEETTLISGQHEDLTEEATIVSGSESIDSISGEITPLSFNSSKTQAQWRSAKSDIVEEVRKRAEKLKESGKSLEDLSAEVSSIVSEKLNIEDSDSEALSKGLFENASERFVTNKDIGPGNGGEATRNRLENEKLKQDITKKDGQLVRMKRLIDSMKRELSIQKEISSETQNETTPSDTPSSENSLNFNVEVNKLKAEVERRDKQIDQLKKNLEITHQNGSVVSSSSSTDLSELAETVAVNPNVVKNLESEVKRLQSQLSVAQNRVDSISQRAESDKELSNNRASNETKVFREKIAKSQEIISKFQAENSDFQKQIFELKKQKEEFENKANLLASNDSVEQLKAKEKELSDVTKAAKQIEDKFRAANLQIKKLEQKNKFITAQAQEAAKKVKKSAGKSGAGQVDPKSAHKIKQLERMNDKLKGSSKKFEQELTVKKKEVHQGKLENNTLKLKIDELERKLSKLDKKAA
jgi:hypothetical protein